MRTFLTKAEAIAQAKKWIEKQGTPPAIYSWETGSQVEMRCGRRILSQRLDEVHSLQCDSGGNGGVVVAVGGENDVGQAIAIILYDGDHKAFLWDARETT